MKVLSITETKEKLIDFLFSRAEYKRKVNSVEYQTRCPFCGDSYKDLRTGHFYMRIDPMDKYNIPCICFKCNYKGIVTVETLKMMGATDEELLNGISLLNKKGKYSKKFVNESEYRYFERVFFNKMELLKASNISKIEYVKNRLGIDFDFEELSDIKIIPSLYQFLIKNEIKESPFNKATRMVLERDYVGFLSSGNSHILFRDITETHDKSWVKYPIDSESRKNKVFYGTSSAIDLFTEEDITINLSEGVFDAIGIKYHLDYKGDNIFNLAVCGQNYDAIILHLITTGIFGENVTLNIFSDNDENFNDNKVKASSEANHRKYLSKYKGLFKSINLFYNVIGKDYGVKKEKIDLEKKII